MIDQLPHVWATTLAVVRWALVVWALVGAGLALRAPAGAYVAEGKWRKEGWVTVCAVSALLLALTGIGMIGVIAIVAVGVFYADVRPAVSGTRR